MVQNISYYELTNVNLLNKDIIIKTHDLYVKRKKTAEIIKTDGKCTTQ